MPIKLDTTHYGFAVCKDTTMQRCMQCKLFFPLVDDDDKKSKCPICKTKLETVEFV